MPTSERKCPSCAGTELRRGVIPDTGGSALSGTHRLRFKPEENWVTTHQIQAFVCLRCGYVGLWLADGELESLKQP